VPMRYAKRMTTSMMCIRCFHRIQLMTGLENYETRENNEPHEKDDV
jgi:hypothetical protein